VQRRFLKHQKKVLEEAHEKISGPESEVGKRAAEVQAKLDRAKKLRKKFESIQLKSPEDRDAQQQLDRADETIRLFEKDLSALSYEREQVLDFLREAEALIPVESERIERAELVAELEALRGEAKVTREISREIILAAPQPTALRFVEVNSTRERLLQHSLIMLDGPGSLTRFLSEVERGEESKVGLTRKLRLVSSD
jgi:hypothetical protein